LVSKLNNSCCYAISEPSRHLQHYRITGFQTAQHSLEISQGCNRHAVYSRNHIAFVKGLLAIRGAQLRREPTWINFLNVEATHSREMFVSDQLLRELTQRQSQV